MANVTTVKLTGIKQLEKNLKFLEKLTDSASPGSRAINASLNTGLNPIQTQAKAKTPSDTGMLKKSLKKKTVKTRKRNLFLRMLGYARNFKMTKNKISGQAYIDHAGIQEEGTKNQKGNFMLEKAYEAKKKAVFKATIDGLNKAIFKEIRKLPLYK